jgi:LPXTG-motif cell wall-anchored protein
MTIKRSAMGVVAAVFVTSILALGVGTAGAQGYVPGVTLVLSSGSVAPGGSVTATASGCQPGSEVTFTLDSGVVLGTLTADDQGSVSQTVVIPTDFPLGDHTVTGQCVDPTGAVLSVSSTLAVTATGTGGTGGTGTSATPTSNTGTLPTTGSDSTNLLRAGVLLVAAGGAVVLITRKRAQAKFEA